MALTTEDLVFIRGMSGDDCDPLTFSDAQLQVFYTAADVVTDGDIDRSRATVIVRILERRWAKAKAEVGKLTDFGTAVDRANIEHIKELLDYWRGEAGMSGGGRITVGVLDYNLDAEYDDGYSPYYP